MLNISMAEITGAFEKLLQAFKKLMAWLGILILPDDGEYDDYPTDPPYDWDDIVDGAH